MSFTSKSPVAVARYALSVAEDALAPYAHRFSPKKYTQHQLFACLALKSFFKTDYRGIVVYLEDLPDLAGVLGLDSVPHWTTLQKAAGRVLAIPAAERLLAATLEAFSAPRRVGRRHCACRVGEDVGALMPAPAAAPALSEAVRRGPARAGGLGERL